MIDIPIDGLTTQSDHAIWWSDIFGTWTVHVNNSLISSFKDLPHWNWSHPQDNYKTKLLNISFATNIYCNFEPDKASSSFFVVVLKRTRINWILFLFKELVARVVERERPRFKYVRWDLCKVHPIHRHFILVIKYFSFIRQCFCSFFRPNSEYSFSCLFAHIIYTWLRLFIAMCLFSERLYNLRALNRSEQRANIASVSVCWIFELVVCWFDHSFTSFAVNVLSLSLSFYLSPCFSRQFF